MRVLALLNWSTTAGQQKTIQVQGLRLSEVAAGRTQALDSTERRVYEYFNKQGSILPNQVVLITFTMPDSATIIATWGAQSLPHPDSGSLPIPASSAVLAANLVADGDGESATLEVKRQAGRSTPIAGFSARMTLHTPGRSD